MRRLQLFASSALMLALSVNVASAAGLLSDGTGGEFGGLLTNILELTNTILIPFIIGIGFLVFVWGIFQYFIVGGANDEAKEKGKSLMVYATLGFVLIIVFWGIVSFLIGVIGIDGGSDQVVIPSILERE